MPSYDETALATLYQRHMPVLLSFIRRYVSTREDAEDVLLEVFIAAFERKSLAGLSEGEQLAWLRRVAHNKCVDVYRRTPRQPVVPLEKVTESVYEEEEHVPEQVALRSEEYALLYRHLANLSEEQQTLLRLCNCIAFVEGLRWEGRVEEGVKAHANREASIREDIEDRGGAFGGNQREIHEPGGQRSGDS